MDGVHVAGVGLDGVVVCRNRSHGAHQAAAHHTHAATEAAMAAALAIAAARSRAGILAGWRSGTGILSNCCGSESNSLLRLRTKSGSSYRLLAAESRPIG